MNRRTILAARLTRRAAAWLVEAQRIQILHVFENSINLINENKSVISLTAPTVNLTPISIVLSDRDSFELIHRCVLEPEKLYLRSSDDALSLGPVEVGVRSAEIWDASIDWYHIRSLQLENGRADLLSAMERQLGNLAPEGSIIRSLDARENGGFSEALVSNIRELLRLLRDHNWMAAGLHSRAICGLGVGLTPAGDDFLMGVIYALHTLYGARAGRAVRTIFESCRDRTTTLSTAWLAAAAAGEASEPWHRLWQAVRADDRAGIDHAVTGICITGHTSGADALAGFVLSINAIIGKQIHLFDINDDVKKND